MRIGRILCIICATIIMMAVTVSAAAETVGNTTMLSAEQKIEDNLLSKSFDTADSFVQNYYMAIFNKADCDFLSLIKSKNLFDYLSTKIKWLSSISADKENIKISTELLEQEITQSSINLCLNVQVNFNYVGNTTKSGLERCVQIVLSNDCNPQILDVFINDNVDDYFRGDADLMSATYECSYWYDDALSLDVVSDISDIAETETISTDILRSNFSETAALDESNIELKVSASSTITTTQRNRIVNYALANCDVDNPVSGNSTLISKYYDFSQITDNYDCTNFTSHCLLAGGAKFNETKNTGWYYKSMSDRTPAWSSVKSFHDFISNNSGSGPQAKIKSFTIYCPMSQMSCELGDIVQIDKGIDGKYDHNVVVTDFYKYNNYSYVAMVSGRSGSSSGLSHWTDNNEVYDEVYPISTNRARVVHLTTLG